MLVWWPPTISQEVNPLDFGGFRSFEDVATQSRPQLEAFAGDHVEKLGTIDSMTEKYYWANPANWAHYWTVEPAFGLKKTVMLGEMISPSRGADGQPCGCWASISTPRSWGVVAGSDIIEHHKPGIFPDRFAIWQGERLSPSSTSLWAVGESGPISPLKARPPSARSTRC